jgi:hypothetical protein
MARVYTLLALETDAGKSSAAVSGTGSVFLLPMKPHGPGGALGEELAGVGVLLGVDRGAGELPCGIVMTRIAATAAMIAPAAPIASQAGCRFFRLRPAARLALSRDLPPCDAGAGWSVLTF